MEFSIESAHALRFLSVDAIELAKSGHPGMPLGMADIATVLWQKHLRHDPANPDWLDRDRFVLSNGHGSMLLYSLLHLTGYQWSINDLRSFRQLGSKTPGHPELMQGIDTTTGPLGQGLANAVGMALAEQKLSAKYNTNDCELFNHRTYVFVGDGCLMEGVSHEVSSFAGHHNLGKLIVFWDNNSITIDGAVSLSCNDHVEQRFAAYGWQVISDVDGHDMAAIDVAILAAKANTVQPTLIACKTQIGWGSAVAGSAKAHGAPLGQENILKLRQKLNWPHAEFCIPQEIYELWDARDKGAKLYSSWLEKYQANTALEAQLNLAVDFSDELYAAVQELPVSQATRKSSSCFLAKFANRVPGLIGGSADLTPSVLTDWPDSGDNYINYGVREFGMFAIISGLSLHGGFLPFAGTFLTFADYGRSAIRMAAMMGLHQIYVFTHDSIGLGEDGPTHQPIEHLAILRATPGLETWRPCDSWETFVAWHEAIVTKTTTALALSRQALPRISNGKYQQIAQGAYICWHSEAPDAIIIATGSEVHLAIAAAKDLAEKDIAIRVVSMPCMERFAMQSRAMRDKILPSKVKFKLAIEAGNAQSWWRWVGDHGKVISVECYGQSAPASILYEKFGFTVDNIISKIKEMLEDF